MSIANVFDIAGMGMSVQTVRLNTIASNIANAETVAGSAEQAYRGRHPVFVAQRPGHDNSFAEFGQAASKGGVDSQNFGVMVSEIMQSQAEPQMRHQPGHPLADENGYVYVSNVNPVEEMADMIAA